MVTAVLDAQALGGLVREAQRGSPAAAERLVRAHEAWVRSAVYAVLGRVDLVDDVVQQVWTQAWERLGSLQDPTRLRPWLYTIARNLAIDMSQAARRRPALSLESCGAPLPEASRGGPDATLEQRELRTRLLQAIESLPVLYREPFVLRHLEDWNYAQISEVLGLPIETVETRLVRARRMLREMLAGKIEP